MVDSSYGDIISATIGFVTAVVMGLWKIFNMSKDIAVLNSRLESLERLNKSNKEDIDLLENKILLRLDRLEQKIDHFLIKD